MGLLFLLPLALLGGMAVPTQFAVNTQLRDVVGGPVVAGAVSFIVGAVALTAAALVVTRASPQIGAVGNAPWWVWTGGILGAVFVIASVVLTPRLGTATTVGLFLAGQVIASVVIDHFGLLGVTQHHLTFPRFLGVVVVLVGVFLVQRF